MTRALPMKPKTANRRPSAFVGDLEAICDCWVCKAKETLKSGKLTEDEELKLRIIMFVKGFAR